MLEEADLVFPDSFSGLVFFNRPIFSFTLSVKTSYLSFIVLFRYVKINNLSGGLSPFLLRCVFKMIYSFFNPTKER